MTIAIYAAINAPSGSPGPASTMVPSTSTVPARILLANPPTIPAVAADTATKGGSLNLCATPTPMPALVIAAAIFPRKNSISPACPPIRFPTCWIIVPTIRVANSPIAIPLNPSIKMWFKTFFTVFIFLLLNVPIISLYICLVSNQLYHIFPV